MDSGPGDDSIERIGEEAHLGCAEDPGKDGLDPGLGSAMIAPRGMLYGYAVLRVLVSCVNHQQTISGMVRTRESRYTKLVA